jgi:hypothetical protein
MVLFPNNIMSDVTTDGFRDPSTIGLCNFISRGTTRNTHVILPDQYGCNIIYRYEIAETGAICNTDKL